MFAFYFSHLRFNSFFLKDEKETYIFFLSEKPEHVCMLLSLSRSITHTRARALADARKEVPFDSLTPRLKSSVLLVLKHIHVLLALTKHTACPNSLIQA